jgi:hypothetical protein
MLFDIAVATEISKHRAGNLCGKQASGAGDSVIRVNN